MHKSIEEHIRDAAQALSKTYRLPTHIVEEDLVAAILPHVKENLMKITQIEVSRHHQFNDSHESFANHRVCVTAIAEVSENESKGDAIKNLFDNLDQPVSDERKRIEAVDHYNRSLLRASNTYSEIENIERRISEGGDKTTDPEELARDKAKLIAYSDELRECIRNRSFKKVFSPTYETDQLSIPF